MINGLNQSCQNLLSANTFGHTCQSVNMLHCRSAQGVIWCVSDNEYISLKCLISMGVCLCH